MNRSAYRYIQPLILIGLFTLPQFKDSGIARAPSSTELNCFAVMRPFTMPKTFSTVIDHPDLYLWDNFGYIAADGTQHVYAMAASREYSETERHFHAHWHRFSSTDQGQTWRDGGIALAPNKTASTFDSQSIWSGTVTPLSDGRVAAFYTGLEAPGKMKQAIGVAISNDGVNFERMGSSLLSYETRRDEWQRAGYYLDTPSSLGQIEGEVDGTIQALRDPFLLETKSGELHLFFAAKMTKNQKVTSAIGHVRILDRDNFSQIEILPPLTPPDTHLYNQIELPNVVEYQEGKFAWIVSTKTRLSEEQPELETMPAVRMYYSDSLATELRPYQGENSLLMDGTQSGLYGMTVMSGSLKNGEIDTRLFVVADGFEDRPFSLPATQKVKITP